MSTTSGQTFLKLPKTASGTIPAAAWPEVKVRVAWFKTKVPPRVPILIKNGLCSALEPLIFHGSWRGSVQHQEDV